MLLVASVAFSASADATLNASKQGSPVVDAKRQALTQTATARPDTKEVVTLGQVRSPKALNANALRSAYTKAVRGFKKPIAHEAANVPAIYGSVIYSDSWSQDNQPAGLYEVPTNASQTFNMVVPGPQAQYGGVLLDGVYYTHSVISFWGMTFFTFAGYDIETGEVVYESGAENFGALSMGMAEYNGAVYGIFYNDDITAQRLGSLEYAANGPVVTGIATLDGDWAAFAVDGNGQGYGIKKTTVTQGEDKICVASTLCKIDLATGAVTEVGETGLCPQYITGMAFEKKSNRLFWTVCPPDETGVLAEVNTSTGEATVIYEFPDNDEVTGLYIPTPPADGVPSAATGLAVSFPEGKLNGTVKFNVPANLYGGAAGEGTVNYTVTFNNEVLASGTAEYGKAVSENVTVANAGDYKIAVVLENAEGKSPVAKTSLYIGVGVPTTPEVTLAYEGGNMKISWTPVTTTVEGGYIDEKAVTYDVVRYPGAVAVGSNLNVNALSQEIEETEILTQYYYTVVAHNGEKASAAGKSNIITLGRGFPTPYSCTFDEESDLDLFTIIDANGDETTWAFNGGMARAKYNLRAPMDDWLITPPVKLEAGKLYEFTFDAKAYRETSPERMEVYMGQGNTVADMTKVIIEPTEVTSTTFKQYKARVVAEASGYFNFGIHGISDANMWYLDVDNIAVSGAMNADIPAAVSDLVVEPGTNGDLYATLTFVSPAKLLSGKDIKELTKIEVLMDGEVIATPRPLVNTKITVPAVVEEDGTYNFTVVAYNENGASDPASASAYIGIDYPEAIANVKMNELVSKPGEVTISWDAVTKDVRGNTITPAYSVYELTQTGRTLLAGGLTEPKYVCTPVAAGEQDYIQYAVFANSKRGEGEGALVQGFVGTPYDGYFESFANGGLDHNIIITDVAGSAKWALAADDTFSDLASADLDGGFIIMQGKYLDDAAAIMLGKISLANLEDPAFTFFTYNINNDDANIIEVYINDRSNADGYQLVYENYVSETGAANSWNKVLIDLSDYAGKEIEIKVGGSIQKYTNIMFDAFKVADRVQKDLSVKVDAPATVVPGKEINVNVTVKNEADMASEAYVAKLKANNVVFATLEGEALEMGAAKTFQVPYAFSAVDEEPVEFVAEVIYEGDENKANNVTDAFVVTPKVSIYPVPVDLAGEVTPEGVQLSWGEPDLTGSNFTAKVEDFEAGEAGDMEFEGWTFVDVDGSPVGGFQDNQTGESIEVPGVVAGETLASFFMFDASLPQFNESYAAHSGTKYLAAMYRSDDGQADDWAISPMLTGNAQTISFFAKSYSADYPEKVEVYYSNGSLDTKEFVKIEGAGGIVPGEWTLYSAEIPEGAKYFAIRSCASGAFMLMIDDVTYETGIDFKDLSIVGYNVYRNAVKVNAEPEAECEYLDTEAVAQNNEYAVTAVYTVGESKASDKIMVTTTGIDNVLAGVEIVAEAGQIIVTGAEGQQVSVVAVDGKVVFAAAGEAKTVATVTPGVYVVKAGAKVAKVLVK